MDARVSTLLRWFVDLAADGVELVDQTHEDFAEPLRALEQLNAQARGGDPDGRTMDDWARQVVAVIHQAMVESFGELTLDRYVAVWRN